MYIYISKLIFNEYHLKDIIVSVSEKNMVVLIFTTVKKLKP